MRYFLYFTLLILCLCETSSYASDIPPPIGVNLFSPVQFPSTDETIVGFRLNILYGQNKGMYGFDFGALVSETKEKFVGVGVSGIANITGQQAIVAGLQAAGIMNINHGSTTVYGLQLAGLFNNISGDGKVFGFQIAGLGNFASKTDIYGIQLGLYNKARKVVGFQFGLLNFCDSLHGIQIGVLNFSNHALLGVSPVINIGF